MFTTMMSAIDLFTEDFLENTQDLPCKEGKPLMRHMLDAIIVACAKNN